MTYKEKLTAVRTKIEWLMNNHDSALDYEAALEDVRNFIDSLQEEPKKKCMYSNDNYTNEDRQVLCDGCEELCKYNSKTVAESLGISQEEYDKIVDECIYGKEPELVDVDDLPNKEEEPVSEDLEEAANNALNNVLNTHEIVNVRSCLEMFKFGAEWKGKQDKETIELAKESVSGDLEDAATKYGTDEFPSLCGGCKHVPVDAFKAGANWQKEKEYTCYEEAFEDGAKWKKEQMMAKAIDGDITFDYYGDDDKTYGCIAHDSFCLEDKGLKDRDKVKLIIIKEE